MTKDEALKLVLDWAYSNGETVFAGGGMKAVDGMNAWTKAIREALAQPEQEPVAWAMLMPVKGDFIDAITPDEHARVEGEYKHPLYTTPPQRKPLTDEQERKAFEDWAVRTICNPCELQRKRLSGYGSLELNYLWRGWKARAAHGIKGDA